MNWSTGTWSWANVQFIKPGLGLVSAISEAEMIQEGKHPGKTNLTDVDNALNILKFLLEKPAAVIVKHNNPCGVAYGAALSEAYFRANRADRIAAFGGAAVFNRPLDKSTAELIARNYLEVVALRIMRRAPSPSWPPGATCASSGSRGWTCWKNSNRPVSWILKAFRTAA